MNKRIFIQKKLNFDVISQNTTIELQNLVPTIVCKVFVIYDLFGITEKELQLTQNNVFADPVTDVIYTDLNEVLDNSFPQTQNYFCIIFIIVFKDKVSLGASFYIIIFFKISFFK